MKCHACNTVTAEIGRIFCPKCGNGGTLRKVAVTVGENGIILAARKPRITLRGTRVSISISNYQELVTTQVPIVAYTVPAFFSSSFFNFLFLYV